MVLSIAGTLSYCTPINVCVEHTAVANCSSCAHTTCTHYYAATVSNRKQIVRATVTDAATGASEVVQAEALLNVAELSGAVSVKQGAVLDGWSLNTPFSQVCNTVKQMLYVNNLYIMTHSQVTMHAYFYLKRLLVL
jgi:hypothetical protein